MAFNAHHAALENGEQANRTGPNDTGVGAVERGIGHRVSRCWFVWGAGTLAFGSAEINPL
jgi:hypothetical protein